MEQLSWNSSRWIPHPAACSKRRMKKWDKSTPWTDTSRRQLPSRKKGHNTSQWQNVHMEFHEEKEVTINISINTWGDLSTVISAIIQVPDMRGRKKREHFCKFLAHAKSNELKEVLYFISITVQWKLARRDLGLVSHLKASASHQRLALII